MEQDIITFEVLKHQLASITDEMMFTLQRTGYSPTTTQAFDFSVVVCDPQSRMLVQGLAVAGHMGSVPTAVAATIDKYGDPFCRKVNIRFAREPVFHPVSTAPRPKRLAQQQLRAGVPPTDPRHVIASLRF